MFLLSTVQFIILVHCSANKMKIKCALFLYISILQIITEVSFIDATEGNEFCIISRRLEEQCGSYTYKAVKPLLGYIHEMKQIIENNNNITENNNITKDKMVQLQQKLEFCEYKNDFNLVQIKDLRSQVDVYKSTFEQLTKNALTIQSEINQLSALKTESFQKKLAAKSETIQIQNEQITQLKKQINADAVKYQSIENLISLATIKEKDDIIKDLQIEAKNETQVKLKQCELQVDSSCINFTNSTGIHQIKVPGIDVFNVLCNSQTAGSGWTVIQQRINGKENFYRNWTTYREGFGSFDGDFFLGLEKIHRLTTDQPHQLYIYLEPFKGHSYYAHYDNFAIAGEANEYKLIKLDGFSGKATDDHLKDQLYHKFSTYDRDNVENCSKRHHGGWWYGRCKYSNLNGKYFENKVQDITSIFWNGIESHKKVQMLIRPK